MPEWSRRRPSGECPRTLRPTIEASEAKPSAGMERAGEAASSDGVRGPGRAVPAHDLRDRFDQPLDPRHGELWHLRDSGLVQTVRLDRDHTVVTLTKEGRDCWTLVAWMRTRERQAFPAGIQSHVS